MVHLNRNSSEMIASISTKVNNVAFHVLLPALTILSSCLMLVMILLALLAIDPLVALFGFFSFGSIYAVVMSLTKKRLALESKRISAVQGKVIKALQEGLGGIRDVLIDGTQSVYCDIYRGADIPLRRAVANVHILSSSPRYGIEALGMVLIAGLAMSFASRSTGIASAIPVLGALAVGAQRLLPMLQQAYAGWTTMLGNHWALLDTLILLEQPLPAAENLTKALPIPYTDSIELKNIVFRYSPDAPSVLANIDVVIPKGGRVGFIGSTGSGKSTLLDVIMGLLLPSEGQILIDGVPITFDNVRSWHARIAHVPQAIFLSDATIAENIAFGVHPDSIDYERVRQAAEKAQIAEAIESWELKYDMVVGERGVRLSGGQRQRIGIARALYKHADVIIFDEATSALDSATESAVMDAIEKLSEELTIIIVAHRITTLRSCTQVVELEAGRIKSIGSYDEVVSAVDLPESFS
jgi:ATP-binding cassette subfamily B protein